MILSTRMLIIVPTLLASCALATGESEPIDSFSDELRSSEPDAVYPAGYDACPISAAYEPASPICTPMGSYCTQAFCPGGTEVVARLPGKPVLSGCFDAQIGDCTGTEAGGVLPDGSFANQTPSFLCCKTNGAGGNPAPACSGTSTSTCGNPPNPCLFWECQSGRCSLYPTLPYVPAGQGKECNGRGFVVPVGSGPY